MQFFTLSSCHTNTELQQRLSESRVGITIGNFDGMHRGHQALFARLFELVPKADNGYRILLSFVPHPRRKLSGKTAAELSSDPWYWHLTDSRRKLLLARQFGFDAVVYVRFTSAIQAMSPEQFVDEVLYRALHASCLVVGDDWRFGKGRQGSAETLAELASKYSITTEVVSEVAINGVRVSSSRVREALLEGDLVKIEKLLGRRFGVVSRVVHGAKRGRELGYPTANLNLRQQLLTPDGVYAGIAAIDGKKYAAAISLGVRPMFYTDGARLLEVHLIDFPWQEFYGNWLEVEFVSHIRSQERFSSVADLVEQMDQDIADIRAVTSQYL